MIVAPDEVTLRMASNDDLEAIVALDNAAFVNPWSGHQLAEELDRDDADVVVAAASDDLLGYAILRTAAAESELLRVAVRDDMRRSGLGLRLVERVVALATARGARRIHLEVSERNEPAIELYRKTGFLVVGRRKGYYAGTGAAALLMTRALDCEAGGAC